MVKEIKVAVLGLPGAGKSTLVIRFIQDVFVEEYDPTIEDSYKKVIELNGCQYLLDIMDLITDEENRLGSPRCLRMVDGLVICIPIDKSADFQLLEQIYISRLFAAKDIDRYDPIVRLLLPIIALTKMDLEAENKQLDQVALEAFASKYGMQIMRTSAKNGSGVREAMERIAQLCLDNLSNKKDAHRRGRARRSPNCVFM